MRLHPVKRYRPRSRGAAGTRNMPATFLMEG